MSRQKEKLYPIRASGARVRDMPRALRPREEADRMGIENVSDTVLLAILLRTGFHGVNVVDLAQSILLHYGSLTELAKAPAKELEHIPGMGRVKAQIVRAAFEVGRRLSCEALPTRQRIRRPSDVARLLGHRVRTAEREIFWVLHLDAKNGLLGPPLDVTQGLLDASLVHPREVFREAVRSAAAAVVVAHNHPSGDPQPSAEDISITQQLVDAGRILGISVLDHVIVGRARGPDLWEYTSLREEQAVNFARP